MLDGHRDTKGTTKMTVSKRSPNYTRILILFEPLDPKRVLMSFDKIFEKNAFESAHIEFYKIHVMRSVFHV